jgi:large subunit ribosomal protein L22
MTDEKNTTSAGDDDVAAAADAPKADKPKADAKPKADKPKADAKPKADKPKADKPKAASKPKADDPAAAVAATPEEKAKAAKVETRQSGESRPVRAVAKYLRFSAQKGRLVVDQIRGKKVLDAATALAFSDRGAAREIMKVLKSAVANAENNHGMRADELYVSAAFVDEGPTFKRFKPRARGRADRINKRTCHVTVIVDNAPVELLEGRAGRKAAGAKTDRSARVAGSKKAAEKAPAKKAPAKKPAAAKKSDETQTETAEA